MMIGMIYPMANINQTNFKFPEHWQRLKSRGAAHFTTQVMHRLPSGNFHIWSSRQFRKRRSTEIQPETTTSQLQPRRRRINYWGWKFGSLTWWIGFIFTLGSILFVVGAIPMMLANPPLEKIAMINFLGSICFTVGSYAALLEAINLNLIVWLPSTVASICFCWASYLAVMEVCHRYWAWKIQDLDWWIVVLNLVGSVGFLSGSIFGFWGQGPIQCCQYWGTNFSFLLGSIFFLGGSYLLVPEMLDR